MPARLIEGAAVLIFGAASSAQVLGVATESKILLTVLVAAIEI
jgi:hypothetical protein